MNKMTLKAFVGLIARLRLEVSNSDPAKSDEYEIIISINGDLYELDIEKGISYGIDSNFTDRCVIFQTKRKKG